VRRAQESTAVRRWTPRVMPAPVTSTHSPSEWRPLPAERDDLPAERHPDLQNVPVTDQRIFAHGR
jgi:hypothetical protein